MSAEINLTGQPEAILKNDRLSMPAFAGLADISQEEVCDAKFHQCMDSPIWTDLSRMLGATFAKCKTPTNRPMRPAIGNLVGCPDAFVQLIQDEYEGRLRFS